MDKDGYCNISLAVYSKKNKRRFRVHILVALVYIKNRYDKPTVNHINGIKYDNRVSNLEWCTYKEQTAHAIKNGLKKDYGEFNYNCKYPDSLIRKICKYMHNGKSNKEIIKLFNKIGDKKFYKLVYHIRKRENRLNICNKYTYTNNSCGSSTTRKNKHVITIVCKYRRA